MNVIEALSRSIPSDETEDQGRPGGQGHKVTLVFFIGGVTFAEVSAFRFLSHLDDGMRKLLL